MHTWKCDCSKIKKKTFIIKDLIVALVQPVQVQHQPVVYNRSLYCTPGHTHVPWTSLPLWPLSPVYQTCPRSVSVASNFSHRTLPSPSQNSVVEVKMCFWFGFQLHIIILLHENIDRILLNKLHGPMNCKFGCYSCIQWTCVIYSVDITWHS